MQKEDIFFYSKLMSSLKDYILQKTMYTKQTQTTKPQAKKQKKTIIIIHDTKSGKWEINELKYKPVNKYTSGFCTIKEIKKSKLVILTAPKWYEYILFGFRILKYRTIKR